MIDEEALDSMPGTATGKAIAMRHGQYIDADELPALARQVMEKHTQVEAAEALGVSQPQISAALRGESRYLDTCRRIVEAFTDYRLEGPKYQFQRKDKV